MLGYLIRVLLGPDRRYLAPEPEAESAEQPASPPITAFPELGLRFKAYPEACAAMAAAVKRFPGHAFMLDVTDLSEQPKRGG